MSAALRRAVGGLVLLGSVALPFVPLAHADPPATTLTPSAEAWYQPNPSCQLPVGCQALPAAPAPVPAPVTPPATSPWPAGSLHVAVAGGQETARSYLAFGLADLGGTVTSAVLDVPLDPSAQDGSVSPETAAVQVCPFTGSVTPADGSVDPPPTVACAQGVDTTYVATPTPHLHADLAPMLGALADAGGLALLPDARKTAQTSTWHVVFSAHDRADAAKTPPASLAVQVTPYPTQTEDAFPPVQPMAPPAAPPLTGTGFAAPPPVQLPAQQPPLALPAAPQPAPVAQARTITVGYAYPAVWLIPLALLVLVPLTTGALTKDLTPRR